MTLDYSLLSTMPYSLFAIQFHLTHGCLYLITKWILPFCKIAFSSFPFHLKSNNATILVNYTNTQNFVNINIPKKKVNIFVYTTKDLKWWINPRDIGKCHKVSTKLVKIELQMELYALLVNGMDMLLCVESCKKSNSQLGQSATK